MEYLPQLQAELAASGSLYLRVKAHPSAKQSGLKGLMSDNTLKVDVSAPANQGKANQELLKLLAHNFGVKINQVKLLSGASDRVKLIKITN